MKIAYLTNCFGTQSHTFIRREIAALRHLGLEIKLYGIHRDQHIEGDALAFAEETQYIYPLNILNIIKCNFYYLCYHPKNYLSGFISAIASKEFALKRRLKMLYHYLLSTQISKEMEKAEITHIHAHFMNVSASIAMYASHHSGIPFSITVHSAGTFKTPHILGVHQKLNQSQFLIMISNHNIDYFDPIHPCADKSHVIRCGMDLTCFKYLPPDERQPQTHIKLLAVGRFVEKKGFIYLIEAAHLLAEKNIPFQLTIIGDGPLADKLKRRARELDVEKHIIFTGQKNTDYVHKTMSESDIVIVPSVTSATGEKEGLPVVIMEAMATGTPVIASDHSGISEIVKHMETGILTPEKDYTAIASAIIETHTQPNREMIEAAKNLVEQTFNISTVAIKRLELFKHYGSDA